MNINQVIIRDINLLLYTNKFSKEFIGYKVISLVDFFSGYNQLEFNIKSRNLMAFIIPLGLL